VRLRLGPEVHIGIGARTIERRGARTAGVATWTTALARRHTGLATCRVPRSALLRALCGSLLLLAVTGCATRVWNESLDDAVAGDRHDFGHRLPDNAEELFVILAFSGGGTRAAAFSYGVLEALRDTQVTIGGQQRRLLDEVDVITSVSGGSYTAAYYGLFGERIFEDFKEKFLYRD
jgi:NTE family protein